MNLRDLGGIPLQDGKGKTHGCTSLRNVSIGDSVTVIGDYAFSGCSSLNH